MRWRLTVVCVAAAVVAVVVALVSVALASFPGTDQNESVRSNTPNDTDYDPCESDHSGGPTCTNVFDEETARFGFAPSLTQNSATYKPPSTTGNFHVQRLMAQNSTAGRNAAGQVSGVSADRAWKYSTGAPTVQVAILDTGIVWSRESLRKRIALNRGELPVPNHNRTDPVSDGPPGSCGSFTNNYDANGDGAFNILDYTCDDRVSTSTGAHGDPAKLDGEDLIADSDFANGVDSDSNGYVDDIAGWDFFDDDNNPYDASSYSSANNHGSGRASDAAEEGNDSNGSIGVCPHCQIEPMRVWDTFVVDMDNFGQAVSYAADNDIEVVEGAVGGLFNSRFAREAFDRAYRKGTFLTIVSSDLNTADHNIPTVYNEAMQVQGTVADENGIGSEPPGSPLTPFFLNQGIATNAPVATWFRNSGTTQYGGHAHIVMPATTGSEATGQASGAIGLLRSYARERGLELQPNELKQLITQTAEDVVPENTVGTGVPDPAQTGWDQHFGYGRPDLGLAMQRIKDGKVPPQAFLTSPDWFSPLNVEQQQSVQVNARLSAPRAGDNFTWRLQWAPGIEPCESDFQNIGPSHSATSPVDGAVGTVDLTQVRAALDGRNATSSDPNCEQTPGPVTGGSTVDPTAPSKGPGDKDPNEPAFTIRVQVTAPGGDCNDAQKILCGEDRRVLFAHRDTTLQPGWPKKLGTGGEASPRMFDLNGDNSLDLVQADSSGELNVYRADGSPLPSFNGGQPVKTETYANVHPGAGVFNGSGSLAPPREVLRTPAIGDIDGDKEPEIVDTAGEHVYAWNADGSVVPGFPVRLDPNLSLPANRTRNDHIKRGFTASPTLGDLNGDGKLDIVAPSLDGNVYVWDGSGNALPGFPKRLRDPTIPGAEIINTAAVGNITGDSKPEIVVDTNEVDNNPTAPGAPTGPGDLADLLRGGLINILANAIGGSGRVYALSASGNVLAGWPKKPNGAVPDALPFAGPGVDAAMGNLDGDPELEVVGTIATGDVQAFNGDGSVLTNYDSQPPANAPERTDNSKVLNLFENPVVANLDGLPGLEVLKGGITLNQLANLGVSTGQNLPYNHVVQAWNGQTGAELPNWPQTVDDYQLLSSPAVANLDGLPGNEVVVGTGLYYLHDIAVTGAEPAGWPKFTGGWLFATPAIGDANGDGKLEVAALTREGNAFMWTTGQPACGTNDESWTARHDEWSTGAYGTDTRPPGTPAALGAPVANGAAALTWKAPGGDWLCGGAKKVRIVTSDNPIQHPDDGTLVKEFDTTKQAGDAETDTEPTSALRAYVGVLYQDAAGNWGHVASVQVGSQPGAGGVVGLMPGTGPGGSGGGSEGQSRCMPRKERLTSRGLAGIRVGDTQARVLKKLGPAFSSRPGRLRFCVTGGRVEIVLSKGRVVLIGSTATGHSAGGIRRGSSTRSALRHFHGAHRIGRDLISSGALVFGVHDGKVSFVAVAQRSLIHRASSLRAVLRKAHLGG